MRRTTIYKGVIIAKRNKGLGSNFSLLNQIDEGERLELPSTYAPSVKGINYKVTNTKERSESDDQSCTIYAIVIQQSSQLLNIFK